MHKRHGTAYLSTESRSRKLRRFANLGGVPTLLAVAGLGPVLITSVWLPPDGAAAWIWTAVAVTVLALAAILLLIDLLIRERRALQRALERQAMLENRIAGITDALQEAETQLDAIGLGDDLESVTAEQPTGEVSSTGS